VLLPQSLSPFSSVMMQLPIACGEGQEALPHTCGAKEKSGAPKAIAL
jgi:hypothetical protein